MTLIFCLILEERIPTYYHLFFFFCFSLWPAVTQHLVYDTAGKNQISSPRTFKQCLLLLDSSPLIWGQSCSPVSFQAELKTKNMFMWWRWSLKEWNFYILFPFNIRPNTFLSTSASVVLCCNWSSKNRECVWLWKRAASGQVISHSRLLTCSTPGGRQYGASGLAWQKPDRVWSWKVKHQWDEGMERKDIQCSVLERGVLEWIRAMGTVEGNMRGTVINTGRLWGKWSGVEWDGFGKLTAGHGRSLISLCVKANRRKDGCSLDYLGAFKDIITVYAHI